MTGVWAVPVGAQTSEVKEKPALYTYVAEWAIPRAKWADMDKSTAGERQTMEKLFASGAIVGYGDDTNLLHEVDGSTHDNWWQAMSMAGILKALEDLAGGSTAPVLASATKHSDHLWVSHYYNWHAGSWKGAYTHWAGYTLKPDAPNDAVDTLAKAFVVPLMEKLLADGAIVEYEIDEEAIHTQNPGAFAILYITQNAEGLDKANAALRDAVAKTPLINSALDSMVDFTKHRDSLERTTLTYK
jgi:hypothetical protein